MITDSGLTNHEELKRLAGNRDETTGNYMTNFRVAYKKKQKIST